MKLSDITILKADHLPAAVEPKPNKLTLSFLSLLIHSQKFKFLLEDLEDELVHTKRNYTYKALYNNKKEVMDLFNWVKSTIKGYTVTFGLPHEFEWQFFTLVYFHCFRDFDEVSPANLYYASTPAEISEILHDTEEDASQNFGALIFFNRVTKEQLHKYIDDDWEKINEEMEWLPNFPTDGSNFKDFYITDDIYILNMSGKSFKEISEYLTEKYPNNEYTFDELWIRNKLSRYKKRIEEFDKKHPPEDED
jgi:hypothetical protein